MIPSTKLPPELVACRRRAARKTREAVKASATAATYVGTSREDEARVWAARKHMAASKAHADAGALLQAKVHLVMAEEILPKCENYLLQ